MQRLAVQSKKFAIKINFDMLIYWRFGFKIWNSSRYIFLILKYYQLRDFHFVFISSCQVKDQFSEQYIKLPFERSFRDNKWYYIILTKHDINNKQLLYAAFVCLCIIEKLKYLGQGWNHIQYIKIWKETNESPI